MPSTPHVLADRLAARQHGLILHRQALTAGLSSRQVERLLATGRWLAIVRGVYRVAAVPPSWRQAALAACLSRPGQATASYLTAAALHGLARPPAVPHITAPPNAAGRSPIAVVHRASLHQLDRQRVDGIPVTGVARTLLDCASMLGDAELAGIVDSAFCDRLSHPRAVAACIARAQSGRGKPGVTRLRRVVGVWSSGIVPGSPAEVRLLRQIAVWGLPEPETQMELVIDGRLIGRIDVGWRSRRFGLEYDGDRFHNPRHWDQDESRLRDYARIGWEVHRVDKYDLRPGQPWLRELLRRRIIRPAA